MQLDDVCGVWSWGWNPHGQLGRDDKTASARSTYTSSLLLLLSSPHQSHAHSSILTYSILFSITSICPLIPHMVGDRKTKKVHITRSCEPSSLAHSHSHPHHPLTHLSLTHSRTHTSHITHHTSHITHHTSHITHHTNLYQSLLTFIYFTHLSTHLSTLSLIIHSILPHDFIHYLPSSFPPSPPSHFPPSLFPIHHSFVCSDEPNYIPSLRLLKVTKIACSHHYSALITNSGDLYTWGMWGEEKVRGKEGEVRGRKWWGGEEVRRC